MCEKENSFVHTTEIQIRFNDVDIVGHVNNVVYQHYFDRAKLEYFNRVVGDKIDWKKITLVMAHVEIDYMQPVYLDEKIFVRTKVAEIGNKSLKLLQEVINDKADVKSRGISILVGFDFYKRGSVVIPPNWKSKIVDFEKEVAFKYPQMKNAD